jgi:hypothetical protein
LNQPTIEPAYLAALNPLFSQLISFEQRKSAEIERMGQEPVAKRHKRDHLEGYNYPDIDHELQDQGTGTKPYGYIVESKSSLPHG